MNTDNTGEPGGCGARQSALAERPQLADSAQSPREDAFMRLLAKGLLYKEIADELGIS